MTRVLAIALNTFREAVRDRVLHGVVGAALALLLFTLALAELSLNQQERVVRDIGLASISFFSVVIAVFLGSSLLYKEIERRTLYVILPKPIARWELLVGKYVGITMTAVVFIAIMGGVDLLVMALQRGLSPLAALGAVLLLGALGGLGAYRATDKTAVLAPWSLALLTLGSVLAGTSGVPLAPVLAQLALVVDEVLLLTAVAMLFSSFSTPFLTGAYSLGVWLVGRSVDDMETMRSSAVPDELKASLKLLAKVVPNFHLFVPGRSALDSDVAGGAVRYVSMSSLYAVTYAALLLVLAALVFRKRELV